MKNNKLIIENIGTKTTAIIIGIIYLFLLIAYIYNNKDNLAEIDIIKTIFLTILFFSAIYMFVNRKIEILLNEDELQIKWKKMFKIYRYKLNDIKIIKFNSSRIEIIFFSTKKTFDISYLKDKDKLKLKKFLINNFDSKYKLA